MSTNPTSPQPDAAAAAALPASSATPGPLPPAGGGASPAPRGQPWRWLLAGACVAVFVLLFVFAGWNVLLYYYRDSIKEQVLVPIAYNEGSKEHIKAVMDSRVDQSKTYFQLGLAVLGLLWGLMITKKDEIHLVLSDTPEIIMFSCANALFLLFFVCHFVYTDVVVQVFAFAARTADKKLIIDISAPPISNIFFSQVASFLAFVVVVGATYLSAHRLKGG